MTTIDMTDPVARKFVQVASLKAQTKLLRAGMTSKHLNKSQAKILAKHYTGVTCKTLDDVIAACQAFVDDQLATADRNR